MFGVLAAVGRCREGVIFLFPPGADRMSVLALKRAKCEAAQRSLARSERKTALFPRNDKPYGLKCEAFQSEKALLADISDGRPPTAPPAARGWRA